MTPQEKSKALYWTYYQFVADMSAPEYHAKQCALIAVDEILQILNSHPWTTANYYWEEVKEEIEKL